MWKFLSSCYSPCTSLYTLSNVIFITALFWFKKINEIHTIIISLSVEIALPPIFYFLFNLFLTQQNVIMHVDIVVIYKKVMFWLCRFFIHSINWAVQLQKITNFVSHFQWREAFDTGSFTRKKKRFRNQVLDPLRTPGQPLFLKNSF